MTSDVWTRFAAVADRCAERPAILRDEEVVTFAALHSAASHAAARLAGAGVTRGEPCVVWGENAPELAVTLLGLLALGAVPAMVNAEAPANHYLHAVNTVGARRAIVDAPRLGQGAFEGLVLPLERIGALGEDAPPTIPAPGLSTTEPASIFFTSGSTGLPKGVTQSHANLIWGCDTVAGYLGIADDDRILCAIPWAFDYGWGQLLSTFLRGITQVMPGARNNFAVCAAVERHRPTILPSVPSLFANLIRGISPIRDIDRSSIRLITNTGSKIPEPLFPDIAELFPDAAISLNYGLTETYRSASLPTALARQFPTSVGHAIPGVTLTIVREDGTPADPGEEGEIVHSGGGVFLGYWGLPEKTAEVRRPDPAWRHEGVPAPMAVFTGDLGVVDDNGLLFVSGRRDRQLKSMGVRVSPDEVESIIANLGLVAEVAIVSRPHEILGDMVIGVVVADGRTPDPVPALAKAARATMSPFMRPMEWNVVDALPRTPSGKIDYPALKRQFARNEAQ